jgi:hypothetical protein
MYAGCPRRGLIRSREREEAKPKHRAIDFAFTGNGPGRWPGIARAVTIVFAQKLAGTGKVKPQN